MDPYMLAVIDRDEAEAKLKKLLPKLKDRDAVIASQRALLEKAAEELGPIVRRLSDNEDMLWDERDTVKIFVPLGELRAARALLDKIAAALGKGGEGERG